MTKKLASFLPIAAAGAWGIAAQGIHRPWNLRAADQSVGEQLLIDVAFLAASSALWFAVLAVALARRRLLLGSSAIAARAFAVTLVGCSSSRQQIERLAPAQATGNLTLQKISFGTDDSIIPRRVEAELGTLRVPESRRRQTGRTVVVRFVRFRSHAPSGRAPIVYLAGGPGGSGTSSAAGDRFTLFMKMREAGDVIALDQRGVAESLQCPGRFGYPLDRPADQDTLDQRARPHLEQCAAYWKDRADISAYTTEESAEDLESLRIALGASKLTLWGISYGTHLGLAYIRRHPDRVERAILAGVEGPDHTYKLPANVDETLKEIERLIAQDSQASKAVPSLTGALREATARLQRNPAVVDGVVVGPLDLQAAVFSMLGEREDIELIVRRMSAARAGDFSGLAKWAARVRRGGSLNVMRLSMDCASGATAARLARIDEQARSALLGDSMNILLRSHCRSWPVDDLGDDFRSPIHSTVPVLFVSGSLDGRTPPSNAYEVGSGFPNGRQMLIRNGAHDDDLFISSPKIGEAFVSFLYGGPTPREITLPPLRFAR